MVIFRNTFSWFNFSSRRLRLYRKKYSIDTHK